MSRFLVLSVIVASISTIVGCGASSASRQASTPVDESCWTPPSEIAMQFNEPKAPAGAAAATAANDEKMKTSMRPNRQDRPSSGAVHAATY